MKALSCFTGFSIGIYYGFYLRENTELRKGLIQLKQSILVKKKDQASEVEISEKIQKITSVMQIGSDDHNNLAGSIDKMRVKTIDKTFNEIKNKQEVENPFQDILKEKNK